MPAGYLAGLDAEAALPGFERDFRADPSVLVLCSPLVMSPQVTQAFDRLMNRQ